MSKDKKKVKPIKEWDFRKCRYYKDNHGHYMTWGLFVPFNKFQTVLYQFLITTHLPIVFYTAIIVYEDEFAEFTEILHFGVLLSLALTVTLSLKKDCLIDIVRKFDTGLHNYGNTLDKGSSEEIAKVTNRIKKRKSLHANFMIYGLYFASFSIIVLRPIYNMAVNQNLSSKQNVNSYLPVKLWYPVLDVSTWPVHIYMILLEYYAILQTTFLVIGSTVIYISTSEEICLQVDILKIALKNIIPRALHAGNGKVSNQVLHDCFKRCVQHHNNIIECFELFQKLYSVVLWLILTVSTYMVCLCLFLTTLDVADMKLTNRLTSVLFLIFEIFHLLIYCWYGEEMESESADIHYELYNSDWIDHSLDMKQHILVMQIRALHPLKISCGGLMFANLNTFSNVCNTAYSYFNILNAGGS